MVRTMLISYLLLTIFLINCSKDIYSKEPSKLSDKELTGILEETEDRDLMPYWLEAEKRETILIKFIAQDKSGSILTLSAKENVSENIIERYILYKLHDPTTLSYAEKSLLFSKVAQYRLKDAVPLIVKALEGESSLNPHIAAARAFGELNARETKEWLEKNLEKEYRESLGSKSPFDESKREELRKASEKALHALEKE
jgi:hypothetical protein